MIAAYVDGRPMPRSSSSLTGDAPEFRSAELGGPEPRLLLLDIAAVDDRRHDRRVRGRAADAALLELLDERRLGVPIGRARWARTAPPSSRHSRGRRSST